MRVQKRVLWSANLIVTGGQVRHLLLVGIACATLIGISQNALAEPLRISGVTESVRDITMSVPEEGIIAKIFYEVGDTIAKNEPVLELENRREQLEEQRRKLVWKSKAELLSATQKVATLEKIVASSKKLYESTQSISKEDLDLQQLEYDKAVSELNQIKIAEEREELEYKIAAENYQRRIIKSPIDGVIVKLLNDVGEYVEPGQQLLQIVDQHKCFMVCQLEEGVGRSLQKGQKVDIEVKAGGEWAKKTGAIVFVSPVVDQASGLLEVKLDFDNSDGSIRPGVPGVMLVEPPPATK